eukprot:TRINITY_DN1431_c0_g1_i1.p1 TRINITY_DN1431_c0_g1~~TRINITY_DN1431_c0_g1_i1.p1  ORF type:complete len:583 (-),score=142.32 TRINITY_DN1431_c0_g1_i1:149-1897(-)
MKQEQQSILVLWLLVSSLGAMMLSVGATVVQFDYGNLNEKCQTPEVRETGGCDFMEPSNWMGGIAPSDGDVVVVPFVPSEENSFVYLWFNETQPLYLSALLLGSTTELGSGCTGVGGTNVQFDLRGNWVSLFTGNLTLGCGSNINVEYGAVLTVNTSVVAFDWAQVYVGKNATMNVLGSVTTSGPYPPQDEIEFPVTKLLIDSNSTINVSGDLAIGAWSGVTLLTPDTFLFVNGSIVMNSTSWGLSSKGQIVVVGPSAVSTLVIYPGSVLNATSSLVLIDNPSTDDSNVEIYDAHIQGVLAVSNSFTSLSAKIVIESSVEGTASLEVYSPSGSLVLEGGSMALSDSYHSSAQVSAAFFTLNNATLCGQGFVFIHDDSTTQTMGLVSLHNSTIFGARCKSFYQFPGYLNITTPDFGNTTVFNFSMDSSSSITVTNFLQTQFGHLDLSKGGQLNVDNAIIVFDPDTSFIPSSTNNVTIPFLAFETLEGQFSSEIVTAGFPPFSQVTLTLEEKSAALTWNPQLPPPAPPAPNPPELDWKYILPSVIVIVLVVSMCIFAALKQKGFNFAIMSENFERQRLIPPLDD